MVSEYGICVITDTGSLYCHHSEHKQIKRGALYTQSFGPCQVKQVQLKIHFADSLDQGLAAAQCV